jgi:hypothetical protein
LQFELGNAISTSHSHRGFSPVKQDYFFRLNRFNGFGAQFEDSREDKPLKRFKPREPFLAAGLKPRRE